jgi:hypothetical protein
MVTEAENDPVALVVMGTLLVPAVSVPGLCRAKPDPVTVTEDPAGPAEALRVISVRPAAWAGTAMPNKAANDKIRPGTTHRIKE